MAERLRGDVEFDRFLPQGGLLGGNRAAQARADTERAQEDQDHPGYDVHNLSFLRIQNARELRHTEDDPKGRDSLLSGTLFYDHFQNRRGASGVEWTVAAGSSRKKGSARQDREVGRQLDRAKPGGPLQQGQGLDGIVQGDASRQLLGTKAGVDNEHHIGSIPVQFRNDLVQRHLVEDQLMPAPGCDAGEVDGFGVSNPPSVFDDDAGACVHVDRVVTAQDTDRSIQDADDGVSPVAIDIKHRSERLHHAVPDGHLEGACGVMCDLEQGFALLQRQAATVLRERNGQCRSCIEVNHGSIGQRHRCVFSRTGMVIGQPEFDAGPQAESEGRQEQAGGKGHSPWASAIIEFRRR
ncbi:hypothetical protein NSPZN2_150022 [Nitrospira defluvii]|uniref:Uncharacterized protein n=1 Tax=Nitrospira defluvii TaxID=330214 RepID=A0ABM8RAA1_9BACT|nr:hypothetical protein NSPZN2_150022 [Nitrospira defluvii]